MKNIDDILNVDDYQIFLLAKADDLRILQQFRSEVR